MFVTTNRYNLGKKSNTRDVSGSSTAFYKKKYFIQTSKIHTLEVVGCIILLLDVNVHVDIMHLFPTKHN